MFYRNINPLIANAAGGGGGPPPQKKKKVSFEFNLVENGICGVGA